MCPKKKNEKKRSRKRTGLLFFLLMLPVLSGCAGRNFYTAASPEVLRTLQPGLTTAESLVLTAGDPDSVVRMDDGTVVYTWLDTVIYTRGLSSFPLWIIGGSRRISSDTYYLEVRFSNGVMTGHRYMSTAALSEEDKVISSSGDLMPGPDPAFAPQFSLTEGEAP